jgi:hypothetical protein
MKVWSGRRASRRAAQRFFGHGSSGRQFCAVAGIAVGLGLVAAASLYVARPHDQGTAHGYFAGPAVAGACTGAPLAAQLTAAVHAGASLIVGTGSLTGRSATAAPSLPGGAPAFYAMRLRSVRTLRGPVIAVGSTAWIPGPAPGTPANPQNATLLAPGGKIFAIVWPGAPFGATLQLVPVVGTDVVFTPYGCWNLTGPGLTPDNYQEPTPLLTVPGNVNFGGSTRPTESGIYTVRLATIEQLSTAA